MRPSAVAVREPACTTQAVQVSVPVWRVTARVKLIFISSVVKTFPAGMTEMTAHPRAVASSVAAKPPCAIRSPFSNSGDFDDADVEQPRHRRRFQLTGDELPHVFEAAHHGSRTHRSH